MKKTLKKNVVVLLILVPFWAVSQTNKQAIEKYLRASTTTKTTSKTVSKSDFEDWDIQSDGGSTTSGISVAYVVQRYKGIEIFGALTNFNIKNGEVIGVTSNAIRSIASKTNTTKPTISITTALSKAYENLNISAKTTPSLLETLTNNNYKLNSGLAATEPIVGNLVYHQTEDEKLLLAWNFTIPTDDHEHLWSVRIDAVTGVLLEKNDLITHCSFENELINSSNTTAETPSFDITYKQIFTPIKSAANSGTYRAIPYNIESPNHGSRMLITNPANALASPYGWHDNNGVDGAEYTITRGNNVWAKDDFMGTNGTDGSSPDGGSSLTFDFPYPGVTVEAKTYIDAANTNLFYMNNIMHDVWYQYGFDEINGNFQDNNYGRGGKKGDYVLADAQDGSLIATPKLNNANFSTPSDGTSGRMQMYLWNRVPGVRSLQISAPESLVGSYTVNQNVFNPGRVDLPIAPNSIQSDLVLYEDGNGATACVVPTNAAAMKGKIVILRRGGGCSFTVKVKFAQDAGATAVIVVNNVPGELSMAGGDANITIPAMSVAKDLGENMIQKMTSSFVYVILQTPVKGSFVRTDGDFDNGVIAHEYGHGISNRLAGGPNNSSCLTNSDQMGEGWSDWFAMMMQLKPGDVGSSKRGIGTFVSGQGPDGMGIRSFPYSTDFGINPMTFADTNDFSSKEGSTSPHGVGSVWATMLWDLTWAYITKYGYDNNIYNGVGGNNKLMKIVLDGIKLQPCNPTFVEARDAIIAADMAMGGKDVCLIWDVFSKRGLGAKASSGKRNVGNDQVEDFTKPEPAVTCTNLSSEEFEKMNVMSVYPNPSKGLVTLTINDYTGRIDLSLIDISGKTVFSASRMSFSNQKQIDLGGLPVGIYLLTVKGANLTYVTKLIIQ